MKLRLLTSVDIPAATAISAAAGWNQTGQDWAALLATNPETCFGVECEGRLVSTAMLSCYGTTLAWIGMVLTLEEYRNRGFAKSLLRRVLQAADDLSIATVKLDATAQGQPIYETLGFIPEQRVERWVGARLAGGGRAGAALEPCGVIPYSLDETAFGANREGLLRKMSEQGATFASDEGFAMRRNGRETSHLGPCVATNENTAEELLKAVLGTSPGAWFWDLMPENENAVRLAKSLGFAVHRKLVRMYRGEPLRAHEAWVYALAGFEFG